MRRFCQLVLTLALTICLCLTTSISQGYASNEKPTGLTAQGAVLIDMQTGQVLFDQNKDAKLYPASITKIITCILALEKGKLTDMVKTSQLAREQEGNRVYLETGEEEPLEMMLYGLMLNSGNDAAVAIAEYLGGSVENFAKMMNEKSAELGAKNTHFVTPNGLHDDNHYTTPYDMALIANYAMKNAKFREIVATEHYAWHGKEWQTELYNLNPMLWNYEGATGVKTGFTDQALQTMVASAKRGDREVMAVVMGVQDKPTVRMETTALLDYGFDAFTNVLIASEGDAPATFSVHSGEVKARLKEDVYLTVPVGQSPPIERKVTLHVPEAPFPQGAKVGTVEFQSNGQTVASAPLFSASDVAPPPPPAVTAVKDSKNWLFAGIGLLLAGMFVFRIKKRRVQQRQQSLEW
ncbi:MAG: D-alanyl-D-alanine carboxypeptidase family protein [Tumebacillaceae bacterium]